ncbi:hypothetical protein Taro_003044 [Colocasia esculenta]|uniref:Uncharacterized protein n=1 Tax=Colocasia esculenta TaxID=4460 RepID=A0A843TI69_COLES|nr:hypothetical protein [Colocasia esculenta]
MANVEGMRGKDNSKPIFVMKGAPNIAPTFRNNNVNNNNKRPNGRVEELLVAEELWNDHKKLIFFPFSSAATCTNCPLDVDQRYHQNKRSNKFVFLIVFWVSRLRWWDFVCPQDREVGLVSHTLWALPDGGLVCAIGVWLVVPFVGVLASHRGFLFRVRERPVVCPLPLLSMGCLGWWCFHMAFGDMSRTVATFVVKAPPLEALVVVWCVALLTYGGRSGALGESLSAGHKSFQAIGAVVYCTLSVFPFVVLCLLWRVLPVSHVVSAIGATVLHHAWFWYLWWHHVLMPEWFVLCHLEHGCIVLYLGWLLVLSFPPLGHLVLADALWLYHYRCRVAALPCLVVVCPCRTLMLIWLRSSGAGGHCLAFYGFLHVRVFCLALVGLVRGSLVELSTSACMLCAIVVRPGLSSRSAADLTKTVAISVDPVATLIRGERFPSHLPPTLELGGLAGELVVERRSVGASWSEEEAAVVS